MNTKMSISFYVKCCCQYNGTVGIYWQLSEDNKIVVKPTLHSSLQIGEGNIFCETVKKWGCR
jgi:hypothetical protein